eukprot:TRINITY_DN19590_c0_g2_i2.p1 TRINITY_DN19590_c0_g2~~TRINITY_DN19590_c0_g2_i2.p1  ORF type:complete len:422 (-),score=63.04 TRINITY_DN19590_c0_g2_i2:136-1224(-)
MSDASSCARCSSQAKQKCQPLDENFVARLHSLLLRLSPQERRTAIAQRMTQAERLELERWMLKCCRRAIGSGDQHLHMMCREQVVLPSSKQKQPPRVSSDAQPDAVNLHPSLAGYVGTTSGGYVACVHLAHGLHMQSSWCRDLGTCVSELGRLVAFRTKWREDSLASAVIEGDAPLYFRAHATLMGLRFAAPLRRSLAAALSDWRRMHRARGVALLTRGSLKRGYSPTAAELQWERVCSAWSALWAEHGRSAVAIAKDLVAKERARHRVQQRAIRQWEDMKTRAVREIEALLAGGRRRFVSRSVSVRCPSSSKPTGISSKHGQASVVCALGRKRRKTESVDTDSTLVRRRDVVAKAAFARLS